MPRANACATADHHDEPLDDAAQGELNAPPAPAPESGAGDLRALRALRALLWNSIDNAKSKDLDQIEFAEELPDKGSRLPVGVADVDLLVTRGSALD